MQDPELIHETLRPPHRNGGDGSEERNRDSHKAEISGGNAVIGLLISSTETFVNITVR